MSLETLIFTTQRETFTRFVLPLHLGLGNSVQNLVKKEALCLHPACTKPRKLPHVEQEKV